VVDEIAYLVKNYGVKEIHFSDDNISVNKNRITGICNEIIERKLNIRWACPTGIAIWNLDENILRTMKKAGCYRLTFGLESGNKETLEFIGKKYSYETAKKLIKLANKLGFWTASTFIFGFPQEKKASIDDTISLALNSDLDFAVFYTPVIFPGTRLFDVFMDLGIKYDPEILGVNNAYDSLHFSGEQLLQMRAEANSLVIKKRLADPLRFFNKIRNPEDFIYVIKIGNNFLKNFLMNRVNKNSAFGLLHKTKLNEAA
jgi:magnesium-protoporphyrin IX monomethyl ester (oxidative) cyclase